jgi:hypothetical protein
MPEERSAGLLVSPMGHAEQLSPADHANLELFRQILNEETGLSAALTWFLHLARKPEYRAMNDAAVVKYTVAHYMMHNADDGAGLLITRNTDLGEGDVLSAWELEVLSHTLITLRFGGWFPGWLARQVGTIADAKDSSPDDRYPSPLKIAGTLGLDIVEWQDTLAAAKEFVAQRPDLLFPATPPQAGAEPALNASNPVADIGNHRVGRCLRSPSDPPPMGSPGRVHAALLCQVGPQSVTSELKSHSRVLRPLIGNIQRRDAVSLAQLLDGFAINLEIAMHPANQYGQIYGLFDS